MKHRGIDFDIDDASPPKWRWKIYEMTELDPKIISDQEYRHAVEAVIACICKINSELGGANDARWSKLRQNSRSSSLHGGKYRCFERGERMSQDWKPPARHMPVVEKDQ